MLINNYIWKKTYEDNYVITLSSNLKENDFRLKKWNDSYYYSDDDEYYHNDYSSCRRNYMEENGFYISYKKKQIKYNIYKRNENFKEILEIYKFNLKCISSRFGIVIQTITLSIDKDIKAQNFKIIRDEYFNEKYKNYLLIYNNLYDFYIKTHICDFEILYENYFNYTYLKLEHNNKTNKFYEFINKFDNIIKEIVGNNDEYDNNKYISIIKKDNIIKIKIKNNLIKPDYYENNIIYIKCNRLYMIKDKKQWGVSLVVDKIVNNIKFEGSHKTNLKLKLYKIKKII